MAKKAVVIGLDAALVTSIRKYVEEGKLPVIAKLMKDGVWAENCLVPHPTITPPNWTTIATGAWPGTHGITCFHIHKPGMELDETYQAFSSGDCQAEYIWEATERAGKKSIILNYPSTYPPRVKNGIQIGGAGLHVNDWRITKQGKCLPSWSCFSTAADAQLFSTEEYPFADIINLKEAKDWKNLPNSRSLEAEIRLGNRSPRLRVEPKKYYLLVQDKKGKGYDTVSLTGSRDGKDILFSLRKDEWSPKTRIEFNTEEGKKKAVFMAKLLELSEDARAFRLYFTPFCQMDGWAYPSEIAKELENLDGLPFNMEESLSLGWIDLHTYLENIELENKWLGETANHLLKNHQWNLFFMHAHCPDHAYHIFINKLDPDICNDTDELTKYREVESKFYISLDKMIGRITEAVNEETLIVITSDHGAVPTENKFDEDFRGFDVGKILKDIGLTVYKKDEKTDSMVIDWQKTKAVCQRSVYIYINLKGRDPHGIVDKRDYEKLQDEIINGLYDYTDQKTGKKPIAFAFKKEDARMIGLYGDRIGDIVYGIKPEFSGEHGRQLPTGEYGIGSMKGLLIMKGPNIKRDYILERTVWLTDIVPTICYLTDLPIPRHSEGGIIYQALEDPDFKQKEIKKLKNNYERVKKAYEVQASLTHEYGKEDF